MVAAKLTDKGEFQIAGDINTRLPLVTDGLVASFPFDGDTAREVFNFNNIKVLGCFQSSPTHAWYDWFQANTNLTDVANLDTVTVAMAMEYDLVLLDRYVWSVTSAHIDLLKSFVEAGVSCIATGNDTLTNYFVTAKSSTLHATHDVITNEHGLVGESDIYVSGGSGDLYGGITTLANDAVPAYYRMDNMEATGFTYTSATSGAVLYFDLEGLSLQQYMIDNIIEAYRRTSGNMKSTGVLTFEGIGCADASTNLYADGDFVLGTLHPVVNGPWSIPNDMFGPSGQPVTKITADGTTNWHGRDIPATVGSTYTASCLCLVSTDCDSTSVGIVGEQGFLPDAYYDFSKKGTWQLLSVTGECVSANARILAYQRTAMTTGCVYFTDIQFINSTHYKPFTAVSNLKADVQINFNPMQDISIFGEFVPFSPFDDTYDFTPNQAALIGFHDTVSGGNIYYRYYAGTEGDSVSSPFLDPDGSFGTLHRHQGYDITPFETAYYLMRKTGNTLSIKLYQNGWKGEHIADIGNYPIDRLTIGQGTPIWSSEHKNLSIYDKLLSEAEALKLIKGTHSITMERVISKRVSLYKETENEDIYFPFDNDSYDFYKSITPSKVEHTAHEEGGVFIGEGTTNEFNEAVMVDSDYGGPGILIDELDVFGGTNQIRRVTGKVRFGNSTNVDVGTIYYGNTYTFSIYLRKVLGVPVDSGMEFDIVDRGGDKNFEGELADNLTIDWQRFTITALHDNNTAYHFIDIGKYAGTGTWEWCCPQIEQRDFVTPYTEYDTVRGQGRVHLPYSIIDCKQDFCISGWWNPQSFGVDEYRPCLTRNVPDTNSTYNRILIMTLRNSKLLRTWVGSNGTTECNQTLTQEIVLNEWNFFCFRRLGNDLILTLGNSNGLEHSTNGVNEASYLDADEASTQTWQVGQYIDDEAEAFHKDYIFHQGPKTNLEVESMFQRKLKATSSGLIIQNNLETQKEF